MKSLLKKLMLLSLVFLSSNVFAMETEEDEKISRSVRVFGNLDEDCGLFFATTPAVEASRRLDHPNYMAFTHRKGCIRTQNPKHVFIITGPSSSGKSSISRLLLNTVLPKMHNFYDRNKWILLAADNDIIEKEDKIGLWSPEDRKWEDLFSEGLRLSDLDYDQERVFESYFGDKRLSLENAYLAYKIVSNFSKNQNLDYVICDLVLDEDTDKKDDFINLLQSYGNIVCHSVYVMADIEEALERIADRNSKASREEDTRTPNQFLDQYRSTMGKSPLPSPRNDNEVLALTAGRIESMRLSPAFFSEDPEKAEKNRRYAQRVADQMRGEFGLSEVDLTTISPKLPYDCIVKNVGRDGKLRSANKIANFISSTLGWNQ